MTGPPGWKGPEGPKGAQGKNVQLTIIFKSLGFLYFLKF